MATLTSARRLVVKIGSALLVDRDTGLLRSDWLQLAGAGCSVAQRAGDRCYSGLVWLDRVGTRCFGFADGGLASGKVTGCSRCGPNPIGPRSYEEALTPYDITTAQVLVTLEDSEDRRRYLNSRATLETLLSLGVVPIVNENDTVATDEIRYGDNDRLAAQIAVTVGADQSDPAVGCGRVLFR